MDISFIVVNYQSQDLLKSCLDSILKHVRPNFEIIVINNDPHRLKLPFENNSIRVFDQTSNLGFGKACNLGAAKAKGEILFFLNPDCQLLDDGLDIIFRTLSDDKVGICAPRLINKDGQSQHWSCGKETNLLDIIKNNLGIIDSKKLWLTDGTFEVDWVSGGAFAIKKELFEACGGFDEKFFLYFEDLDLCRRIRQLGRKILVMADVKVLHHLGASSNNLKTQKKYYYASQDYYFKKHFTRTSLAILIFLRKISLFLGK